MDHKTVEEFEKEMYNQKTAAWLLSNCPLFCCKSRGELILVKDSKVNLYTGRAIRNKRGNIHHKEEPVQASFRLVVARTKTAQAKEFRSITNNFELSPKEIAQAYRKPWDIEVFFHFIKQELNVGHLVSLNKNGIEVMPYMTLTVAILVLIYKKANGIGYKTAKRRFKMEIRNLATAMIVVICKGNLDHFETKKWPESLPTMTGHDPRYFLSNLKLHTL